MEEWDEALEAARRAHEDEIAEFENEERWRCRRHGAVDCDSCLDDDLDAR